MKRKGDMLMRISLAYGCAVSLFLIGCGEKGPNPKATSNGGGLHDSANASPKSETKAEAPPASTDVKPSVADSTSKAAPASPEPEPSKPQSIELPRKFLQPIEEIVKSDRFPWRDVPRGEVVLGNVPLKIDGIITLWGESNAKRGMLMPEAIPGIPVARKFEAIYVYQTAFFSAPDGTPIAKLVFQYADGTSAESQICYGTHVRDWYQPKGGPEELIDPKSKLVWSGPNSLAPASNPNQLQLFIAELPNPHPENKVNEIDVVSMKGPAAICIMAMTTGPAGLLKVEPQAEPKVDETPKADK